MSKTWLPDQYDQFNISSSIAIPPPSLALCMWARNCSNFSIFPQILWVYCNIFKPLGIEEFLYVYSDYSKGKKGRPGLRHRDYISTSVRNSANEKSRRSWLLGDGSRRAPLQSSLLLDLDVDSVSEFLNASNY